MSALPYAGQFSVVLHEEKNKAEIAKTAKMMDDFFKISIGLFVGVFLERLKDTYCCRFAMQSYRFGSVTCFTKKGLRLVFNIEY